MDSGQSRHWRDFRNDDRIWDLEFILRSTFYILRAECCVLRAIFPTYVEAFRRVITVTALTWAMLSGHQECAGYEVA